MDVFRLIKNTTSYKVLYKDKINETLSHATMIVCDDEVMLKKYLKVFASLIMCENLEPCGNCRACKLIESEAYQDVIFYPTDKKIVVADVDDLIAKSYLKPLESNKKLFVLLNVQDMNAQAQNKLLKTLEEPPKDTYILLGATTTYPLLKTLISRVKRLDIPAFKDEEIKEFLSEDCTDKSLLERAVNLSSGNIGEVLFRYENSSGDNVEDLVCKLLIEMKSSKEVAKYSQFITKENAKDVIVVASKMISSAMAIKSKVENSNSQKNAVKDIENNISYGALIFILERLREAEKSLAFNGNIQAVADSICFGIVEGKYKWLK